MVHPHIPGPCWEEHGCRLSPLLCLLFLGASKGHADFNFENSVCGSNGSLLVIDRDGHHCQIGLVCSDEVRNQDESRVSDQRPCTIVSTLG